MNERRKFRTERNREIEIHRRGVKGKQSESRKDRGHLVPKNTPGNESGGFQIQVEES